MRPVSVKGVEIGYAPDTVAPGFVSGQAPPFKLSHRSVHMTMTDELRTVVLYAGSAAGNSTTVFLYNWEDLWVV